MSLNQAQIIGRLGRDPELRYTQSGQPVCSLNVATSYKYTNKQNELVEETEWHRISVWGKQAENCNSYLKKGSQVFVQGRLKTTSYDKDGVKHYKTEIVADTVQFLDKRESSGDSDRQQQGQGGSRSGGGYTGGRQQGGGYRDQAPPDDGGGHYGGSGPGAFGDGGGYSPSDPGEDDIPF